MRSILFATLSLFLITSFLITASVAADEALPSPPVAAAVPPAAPADSPSYLVPADAAGYAELSPSALGLLKLLPGFRSDQSAPLDTAGVARLAIALGPEPGRLTVLAKAADAAENAAMSERLVAWINTLDRRGQTTERTNPPADAPVESPAPSEPAAPTQEQAASAYGAVETSRAANVDGWVLVSNRPESLDSARKLAKDSAVSLANEPNFAAAKADAPLAEAWLYVRPLKLHAWLGATGPLVRLATEPPLKAVVDDVLTPLLGAPYLALSLAQTDGQPELTLHLPEVLAGDGPPIVELLAALDSQTPTFAPLLPDGTVLSVSGSLNRQLVAFVSRHVLTPDLMGKLATTKEDAAYLQAGLPMIEQILNQLKPEVQVIAAHVPFAADVPRPTRTLPAMALVMRPESPAATRQALIMTYLGSIRRANERATAEGRPRLVLRNQKFGDFLATGAVYRAPASDSREFYYNFSPSIVLAGDRYILASRWELALALAKLAQQQPTEVRVDQPLQVDFSPGAALGLLAENLSGNPADASPLAGVISDVLSGLPRRTFTLPGFRGRTPIRVRWQRRSARFQ